MVTYGIFIIFINLTLTACIPVTKICHHDIILTNQEPILQVQSPGFKHGERYPLDIHCKWNISTFSVKAQISLKFLSFDIEQHHLCEWDSVLIYNGFCDDNQQKTKKYRYCGNKSPSTFISENNNLCLELISDKYVRKPGFEAIAEIIEEESLSSATIFPIPSSDHNVKHSYSISTNAEETMTPLSYRPLSLSSSPLNSSSLFPSLSSSSSTVPPSSLWSSSSSSTPFSLSATPSTTISTTAHFNTIPALDIRYNAKNNKTFEMCNITSAIITGIQGYLISPNYGSGKKYPLQVNCTIRIYSTAGTHFELDFLDFDVEYHPSCDWDNLTLYDGAHTNNPVLKSICGNNFLQTITTKGPSVTLQFISDKYVIRRGFKIRYRLIGGPVINATKSTTTSKAIGDITPIWFSSHEIVTSFKAGDIMKTLSTSFETDVYKISNEPFVISEYMASLSINTASPFYNKPYIPTLNLEIKGGNKETFEICNYNDIMVTDMEGYITSPGYNTRLSYDLNLRCRIRLTTKPKNRIKITFLTIDLEHHPQCKYDNVSLYDGIDTSCKPTTTHCGTQLPGRFESKDDSIVLEFISDYIISRKGFKIQFQVLKNVFHSTTQLETVIQESSPLYKSSHEEFLPSYNNIMISAPEFSYRNTVLSSVVTQTDTNVVSPSNIPILNGVLSLSIDKKDISIFQTSASSSSDVASKMADYQSTPILTTTGSTSSLIIDELIPTLILESGGNHGQKFDICNITGTISVGTDGYITSPGFINGVNYGLNLNCKIMLTSKHGHRIRIKFTSFDLEYHSSCAYDSLSIYDDIRTSSQLLKTCGNQLPSVFNSTGSTIMVVFSSDFIISRKGFKFNFEPFYEFNPILPPIERLVDDFADDFESSIVKENSIDLSSSIVSDVYTVQNPQIVSESSTPYIENTNIFATKIVASAESSIEYNYIQQNEIITSSSTTIYISPKQSEVVPNEVSESSNFFNMHLQSSQSLEENNHIIYMCSVNNKVTINKKLEVFSPNYGMDPAYPLNLECSLHIKSSRNKFLKINMEDFQLENHPRCKFDKLTIFDGNDEFADVIANICGEKFHHSYTTTGPEMFLKFVSDIVVAGRGFHLLIQEVDGNIVPTLSLQSTQTTLKDIKMTLQHLHSSSFVHDNENQKLSVNEKLVTEYSSLSENDLMYSTVLIRKDKSVYAHSSVLYAYTPSLVYNSMSSSLSVISTTPYNKINKLPLECNGVVLTFTSPSGVVMSPGFEEGAPYPRDATCSWVIVAKKYQTIILEFEVFALEAHDQCLWDKVVIHDGSSVNSPLIGSFCGDDLPQPIVSTGETLYIGLETDRMVEYRGFKANYTVKSKPQPACVFGQIACNDGHCLPEEWTCDGEKDCQDGEDEKSCGICSEDKFRCGNGDCIANVLQCNGINDCPDGLDEIDCLSIGDNAILKIMYEHNWYPVCSDTWEKSLGDVICHHLLKGDATNKTEASTSNALVLMNLQGDPDTPFYKIHNLFQPSPYCSSRKEVILNCKTKDCGERSVSLSVPYIIGGSRSYLGQWPWVVGIKIGTKFICGGSLISDQWVVTASHCIESISASPHKARILIGAISRDSPPYQHFRATEIIIHPDNAFIDNADIALIRLQRPVNITDYVKPICVQPATLNISVDNAICYVAGWGVTKMSDYYTTVLPDYLNHVKMRLIHQSKCKLAYNNRIKETMFCAGYQYGRIDSCKGDSGSPLMCKVQSKWVLVGVTSWGETPCGQAGKPGVYTRVQFYSEWITTITSPGEPTLSCTFESHSICGYHDISKSSTMWTRRYGGWNRPANDYTTKSQKGHYMYAESSKKIGDHAILTTPTIAEKESKCVSFSFSFYGEPDIILTVLGKTNDNNDTSQVLMKLEHTSGDWKSTKVNVNKEIKTLMFVAKVIGSRNSGIAIDDITAHPQLCNENDFYKCTFDYTTICNYTQLKDDFTDLEIVLSNSSGYHLRFNGTGKHKGDKARLLSPIFGSSSPRCLQLLFRLCNSNAGKISIHSVVEFGGHLVYTGLLWSSQRYINSSNLCSWNQGNVNLKSESYSYKLVIEAERGNAAGSIDLDDIQVYNGNCF